MFTFKTWRDPYDEGFNTCSAREVTLNEGLTVLVGCNGCGKTTMLHNLRAVLKKEKIPFIEYDNLKKGGSNSIERAMYYNNFTFGATAMCSSEGEVIRMNIASLASTLRNFLQSGKTGDLSERMASIFWDEEDEPITTNKRFILLDAIDSGFSVDNVVELKRDLFDLILEDAKDKYEVYIVVSANEYELANGVQCLDVTNGKYITFKDYEDYKKFILKSREKKDKRDEKARLKEERKKK